MGRLLEYREIQNDQIISKDVFRGAKDLFVEMSTDLVRKEVIDGSLIYGSVAVDTMGPRSDFDAITALREESVKNRMAVRAIKLEMQSQFGDSFVNVFDNTVKPRSNFETGNHDFNRFFGQHLSSDDRVVIGNDLATYATWAGNEKLAVEHLREYLANKERRLSKAFEEINPIDLSHGGLQRMLELPCAIGRKALQVVAETYDSPETPIRSVDKKLVVLQARELFGKYDLVDGFDQLLANDRNYNEILEQALRGDIDQTEYEDFIRDLHNRLPDAIGWINSILEKMPILSKPKD